MHSLYCLSLVFLIVKSCRSCYVGDAVQNSTVNVIDWLINGN